MRSSNRLLASLLVLLVIGLPSFFLWNWIESGSPQEAVSPTFRYLVIVSVSTALLAVANRLGVDVAGGATDALVDFAQHVLSGYKKYYLDHIRHRNRRLATRELTVEGRFSLPLEDVYIELQIMPQGAIGEAKCIWEYFEPRAEDGSRLVIVGLPGMGKTTLLKQMTLALSSPSKYSLPKGVRKKLPVLLSLNEHIHAIQGNSRSVLPSVIEESLARMDKEAPQGWFKNQLDKGRCVVMIDGFDTVADPTLRTRVAAWLQDQIDNYPKNHFILTSRPFAYRSGLLKHARELTIRQFDRDQVDRFIRNWYLANERMKSGKDDAGVLMEAEDRAQDLMRRLSRNQALSALAVNPLLVTMIATVDSFKGILPQRRVLLYDAIFEVFLWRRNEVWQGVHLSPDQILEVLKLLGYHMMAHELQVIPGGEASQVIRRELVKAGCTLTGEEFLRNVDDQSGLVLEHANGEWAFAHLTYQEYLASRRILEDRTGELQRELIHSVGDSWWFETTRLYTAQTDATEVISECLREDPPSAAALSLALDCVMEALKLEPSIRTRLETIIEASIESKDRERQALAAEAKLSSRLRSMVRFSDMVLIDHDPVTNVEYQLFLDEMHAKGEHYYPDWWAATRFPARKGNAPVSGLRSEDAQRFCEWLTGRDVWYSTYRLPFAEEVASYNFVERTGKGCWIEKNNTLVLHASEDVLALLAVRQEDVQRQMGNDLDKLLHLKEAISRRKEPRRGADELLQEAVPIGVGGWRGARQSLGVHGREAAIEKYFERRRENELLLRRYETYAAAFDLELHGLIQLFCELFLESLEKKASFSTWLTAVQSVYHLSELDLGTRFKSTTDFLESEARHRVSSILSFVVDGMDSALESLRLRRWAGVKPGPENHRDAYEFLRWYVRLCAAGLGAWARASEQASAVIKPSHRQIIHMHEALMVDLTLLEKR